MLKRSRRDGQKTEQFSLTSHDYEDWAWETDKGSDGWNTEKIGELTAPQSGTYEIVVDELEIGTDTYEMHEIYVWKPKVDI